MNQILLKQKAVDKFIGLFRIKKFRNWYLNIREKVRTIQGAYKKRYLMRHIIVSMYKFNVNFIMGIRNPSLFLA